MRHDSYTCLGLLSFLTARANMHLPSWLRKVFGFVEYHTERSAALEFRFGNGGTEKTADLTGVEITQAVEVKEVPIFSAG